MQIVRIKSVLTAQFSSLKRYQNCKNCCLEWVVMVCYIWIFTKGECWNMEKKYVAEPYKIKAVEPIAVTTREEREEVLEKAGYNTFLIDSKDVFIDLLTDSGTRAMSDKQWAALMLGDESYAGSNNYKSLQKAVTDIYGFKHTVPTHQGRGAENILSRIMIKEGDYIPANMYFTTTRAHQELSGGVFTDLIMDAAPDPPRDHPWKGRIDPQQLQDLISEARADSIPYSSLEVAVNLAGGQPVSMENINAVSTLARN